MKKKENNWEIQDLVILVLPAVSLPQISEDIAFGVPNIVTSMILGAIGGIIGFALYWFVKDRSKKIKIITISILVFSLISMMILFANKSDSSKRGLILCQICGYDGVPQKGKECEVCFVEISESYMNKEGYDNLEDMIIEEQKFFFALEEEFTFTEPKIFEEDNMKYKKSMNWKPKITIKDVIEERKVIEEIIKSKKDR